MNCELFSNVTQNFRLFVLIFVTKILDMVAIAEAREVSCEEIKNTAWSNSLGTVSTVRTCFMDKKTIIDAPDVTISTRDDTIQGLTFIYNKNIYHLPIGVGEKFPNLLAYSNYDCSIKEISKQNFKGLSKLKYLSMGANMIVRIASDTFSDLTSLEVLRIRKKVLFIRFQL